MLYNSFDMITFIIRSLDQNLMIEMDQFTINLTGEKDQEIVRKSKESALTMKGEGPSLKSYIESIMNKTEEVTWCGWPEHLLLPRLHSSNLLTSTQLQLILGLVT